MLEMCAQPLQLRLQWSVMCTSKWKSTGFRRSTTRRNHTTGRRSRETMLTLR
jgi:hypothetical protein